MDFSQFFSQILYVLFFVHRCLSLFEFIFQHIARPESQHQLWGNQQTLFCNRIDRYTLQLLLDFERSKILNQDAVVILPLLSHDLNQTEYHVGGFSGGITTLTTQFCYKFLIVHWYKFQVFPIFRVKLQNSAYI